MDRSTVRRPLGAATALLLVGAALSACSASGADGEET